ncbi:MAG: hypothetical protein Q9222_002593 [Ikaeria aurantiellina]
MGTAEVALEGLLGDEEAFRPRKRFKTSELPLNATQRSTIDGLLHTIKKKGEYDTLRKKVWSEFADSEAKKSFNEHLNELADAEIDRDPSLLSRDRGKAATLLQGAVDRSDIYKSVEISLDRLLSDHLNYILAAGREIRKADIGEEAAAEEQRRGTITDEEYAKEAAAKRDVRERQKKQDEARKRREEEKEQLRIATMKQEAELEKLRKMDERRREREAREEKLKEERRKRAEEEEERRKRYEQRASDEAAKRGPSYQTIEQAISRHGSTAGLEQTRNVSSHSPLRFMEKEYTTATATIPNIDEKAIEEAALEELLREGRELTAKSGTKPQVDRSESLEPPLRKAQTLKTRSTNISPSKATSFRPPIKSEPFKTKLSYSATNNGSRDRSIPTQALPPLQSTRSRSPVPISHSRAHRRSRSRSRSRRQEYEPADKVPINKPAANSQYDHSADYHSRDKSIVSHHSPHVVREDTKEREANRSYYREETSDRHDRMKSRLGDCEDIVYRSSRHDRSRSRSLRGRDRERRESRESGYHRDRDGYREDLERLYDGSNSVQRRSDYGDRHDEDHRIKQDYRSSTVEVDYHGRLREGENQEKYRLPDKDHARYRRYDDGGSHRESKTSHQLEDEKETYKYDARDRDPKDEERANRRDRRITRHSDERDEGSRDKDLEPRYEVRESLRDHPRDRGGRREDEEHRERRDLDLSRREEDRYRDRSDAGDLDRRKGDRNRERREDRDADRRDYDRRRDKDQGVDARHQFRARDRKIPDRDRDRDRGRGQGQGREDQDPDRDSREEERIRDRKDPDRDRKYDRDRGDRERDRDRNRDKDRDRRDDVRDHHYRDKERRDDGRDRDRERDRGKGFVEIDRYVPSGRDDGKRARGGRERSR